MKSGIVKSVTMIYWGSVEDKSWKNAHTDELIRELTYLDDNIRLPLRDNMKFIIANCNRNSGEEYLPYRDTVEYYRGKKVRRCPLLVVELWEKGDEGSKIEYWSIDNDNDSTMKEYLKRLKKYLNTPFN